MPLCIDNFVLVMSLIYELQLGLDYVAEIIDSSIILCKLMYIGYSVFTVTSNNILACLTIERCLMVIRPYKQPPSLKRAFLIVTSILIYSMSINVPYYSIVFGIVDYPIGLNDPLSGNPITKQICTAKYEKYDKHIYYFGWVDFTVLFLIPAISIIVANALIIHPAPKESIHFVSQ